MIRCSLIAFVFASIFLLVIDTYVGAKDDGEKPGLPANQVNLGNPQESVSTTDQISLFPAAKDGKYGFIDRHGKFVIPPTFTSAGYFSEGLAPVKVEGKDHSLGKGQLTRRETGKWGYIDRTGTFKISPQFGSASSFSEGLAKATLWEDRPSLEEFIEGAAPSNPTWTQDELADYWEKKVNRKAKAGYIDTRGC